MDYHYKVPQTALPHTQITRKGASTKGFSTQHQDTVLDHNMAENQGQIGHNHGPSVFSRPDNAVLKYFDYPANKPFINTDYTRADTAVNSFPISDRDAIISGLRNIREIIKKLELERFVAEQNLQRLVLDTGQSKLVRKTSACHDDEAKHRKLPVTLLERELDGQLTLTEQRGQLLEEQLQLKQMIKNSELDRRELMEQKRNMKQKKDVTAADMKLHMGRLNELEQEQRRLTLTQQLVESKIRELEQKFRKEKMQRETLQDRTALLESASQDKLPSSLVPSPHAVKRVKSPKNMKKSIPTKHSTNTYRSEPLRHYRLNLAAIPFVAGKSTGPSHSLGANIQKILATLKLHNTALCSAVCVDDDHLITESLSSNSSGDAGIGQDLSDLLIQLEDEFGQLSSKHQEIMDQLQVVRDIQVKTTLEQELDMLVDNMENKSQQISLIRQHKQKMKDVKRVRTVSTRGTKSNRAHAATKNFHQHHHQPSNKNIKLNTSNKIRKSTCVTRPELFVLRDVKKLQCTLQKDDLYWE